MRGQGIGFVISLLFLSVFILVALSLAPTIANAGQNAEFTGANSSGGAVTQNVSPAGGGILDLIPVLYIAIIVVTVVAAMGAGF